LINESGKVFFHSHLLSLSLSPQNEGKPKNHHHYKIVNENSSKSYKKFSISWGEFWRQENERIEN